MNRTKHVFSDFQRYVIFILLRSLIVGLRLVLPIRLCNTYSIEPCMCVCVIKSFTVGL